jgi:ribosomal protein L37AE/L43A
MQALLNSSLQGLTRPRFVNGYKNTAIDNSNPMMSKHTCPCCSYTLLRHLSLGSLYWRCSHCYQEMPAL